MIDTALYTILINASAVSDLISARIYPINLPQNPTVPALVYQRIATDSRLLHHGGSGGVANAHYQLSIFADDPMEAKTVSAAVRQTLHAYTGTVSGEVIFYIQVDNELDLFDPELENYQVVLDITINHRET